MKLYYYNLVNRPQTGITPSSESVYFPSSNLKDDRRTKVFRVDSSSVSVVFDFTTVEPIDSILLVPHTKNGWGFTDVVVEANATSNFTSPAFSTTISTEIDQEHEIAVKEFTEQNYRFWKLTFNGTTFVEVSKIFMGQQLLIGNGRSIDFGWTYGNNSLHQIQANKYGQKFIDIMSVQKRFSFGFSNLYKIEIEDFYELTDYCGVIKPFWLRIGCESMSLEPNRYSGLVFFDQIPDVSNSTYARYGLSASVSEAM